MTSSNPHITKRVCRSKYRGKSRGDWWRLGPVGGSKSPINVEIQCCESDSARASFGPVTKSSQAQFRIITPASAPEATARRMIRRRGRAVDICRVRLGDDVAGGVGAATLHKPSGRRQSAASARRTRRGRCSRCGSPQSVGPFMSQRISVKVPC
jgi:hypothetical protein